MGKRKILAAVVVAGFSASTMAMESIEGWSKGSFENLQASFEGTSAAAGEVVDGSLHAVSNLFTADFGGMKNGAKQVFQGSVALVATSVEFFGNTAKLSFQVGSDSGKFLWVNVSKPVGEKIVKGAKWTANLMVVTVGDSMLVVSGNMMLATQQLIHGDVGNSLQTIVFVPFKASEALFSTEMQFEGKN